MDDSNFSFNEEIKDISPFCLREGFEKIQPINLGGEYEIYEFRKNGKIYYGKKSRWQESFYIYTEFLLEINFKSMFSNNPVALYIKKDKSAYIMMEVYKNLQNFSFIHDEKVDKSAIQQIHFDQYLNILLITTSLLQEVLVLHVQEIPIIHHDIKPGNVLLSEYQYDSKLKTITKVNISHEDIGKHTLHHFYLSNLTNFDLVKCNNDITIFVGTAQYRSQAFYLEQSDILSVAIIMKILINNFKSKKQKKSINNTIDLKNIPNFVYERKSSFNYINKFYYKNTKILKGLDRVINILANLYYKRSNNIFDVLDILTDREKMTKVISEDFNVPENQKTELINKYIEILDLINIRYTYKDDFKEIAPKIFGENYKAFMFTLFHQKNNEFNPDIFQKYQNTIVDLYKQKSKNEFELFNSISDYHFDINFFCFKQLFTKFSEGFPQTINNSSFTVNSKLFKILISLNFKETRSLNHFSNALHLSLFSVSQEVLYNFLICFGQDYEAKIGFLLLHSKVKDDQDPFEVIINRAKICVENKQFFFDSTIDNDYNDFDSDNISNSDYIDDKKLTNIQIEYDIDINITTFQLLTNNFEDFLKIIDFNEPENHKDDYIKLFEEKISTNKIQNENLFYLHEYNDDAKFLLLIHYLYFYEIKDEKLKIMSFEGDNLDKNNDDEEEEEEEEEENEWEIEGKNETKNVNQYSVPDEIFKDLDYELFYSLENTKCKEKFIWLTLFRLGDLIDDILSQETINKFQNYIAVVKFLQSIDINIVEFHNFIDNILDKNKYDQFKRIVHHYGLNQKINPVSSKLQFLESISYFFIDFFNIIFDKVSKGDKSNKDLIEFITLSKNETANPKINDYFDIRTKIIIPHVVCSFGKIKYETKKSIKEFKITDPTLKSKITVCVTQALNYLTNLPFKIPIQIKLDNILIDEKNGLPIIILDTFDQDTSLDFYQYETAFDCLKQVVKNFIDNEDNNFLNIIRNYVKISNYGQSIISLSLMISDCPNNLILFQYIINLFLDPDSLDLTFKGTNLKEFQNFIDKVIKNEFYDDQFQKFAYELLGQSFSVKLDYLFTRMKLDSNLTKEKFVDEMNEITSNSSLLTLIDDTKALTELSKLFERYFVEDSYNLVHRLNQLVIEKSSYKVIEDDDDENSDCMFQYDKQNLNEEIISYIYHINNKFVSPMKYSTNKYLHFKVSKIKYNDDILERFDNDYSRIFSFYYSLKSAIYYLHNYCDPNLLLPDELTLDDIYINEMDEVIILPYKVNNFMENKILESIKNKLKIDEYSNSIICYSYASYIPLTNQHSYNLMKIFGFDYSTELNEIIHDMIGFEQPIDDDKIINDFKEKCEQIQINDDKHILELSSNTNKLTPLFIHLLEKAKESKDIEISTEANKRLNIYMSIKEIKEGLDKNTNNSDTKNHTGGESFIKSIQYNGKNVVYKKINTAKQSFQYLQKLKNTLYLLKIEGDEVNKYIINEIGFTNFGMIMDRYEGNLSDYVSRCEDPLKLFSIIVRIIEIISFLHSRNLVHCDIKLSNFFINNEGKIYLGDMINIQKEFSFSRLTIFTPDHFSRNLISLKHQDVYAFEVSCLKLFNRRGHFYRYEFPLIEYIMKSKDCDDSKHYDINKYHQIITTEKMYILKFTEDETYEEKTRKIESQSKEISKILSEDKK